MVMILLTAAANGAVTFGVIKTTLKWLEKSLDQAHAKADAAHRRIDKHLTSIAEK